ncbi:MAG: hypothetical protein JWO06_2839 [Bacteroidota bacterium]|nr:hypothetical protein [Bacteroidota bacterium]
MIKFKTTILKFDEQGDKTGWTYIVIPGEIAVKLNPDNRKSFRVKGKLDKYAISQVSLLPRKDGDYIMPFNAGMRKGTGKRKGAELLVQLETDKSEILPPADLIECLADEPKALDFFNSLTKGHQNYFTKWIESAKTEPTKAKRIAQSINALAKNQHFGLMLRALKADKL